MDKQKVYEECMGYAKDFVKPYLIDGVCVINENYHIVLPYLSNYLPDDYHYDIYDKLHRFIALAINGKYDTMTLWRLKGQPLDSKLCLTLVPLLDECKDPKDYQHIIRIIFCMIRNSIYSKNEFIDALKDTTNTPALLEIIKYDDFTVMTDNHRFDLAE
jgi:hypothetical protein